MVEKILACYPVGDVQEVKKITTGLINETYYVRAAMGDFILQKLHAMYGPSVVEDVDAVSEHLRRNGIAAPRLVRTHHNAKLVRGRDARIWRLFSYIPGVVFEKVNDVGVAREAGKMLGKIHRAMNSLQYRFKNQLPRPHATEEIYAKFLRVVPEGASGEVGALREEILNMKNYFLKPVPRNFTIHGDPKISNFVFTPRSFEVAAVIDLDGSGPGSLFAELGDAFRSWCGGAEDDPRNTFNVEKFYDGIAGYMSGSEDLLNNEELWRIPRATALIVLELAARFLIDSFEDNYFGWDQKRYDSRKAHNLARARGQVALYKDLLAKEGEVCEIISKRS